ncbi:hypothetical protein D3C80_1312910 [compost metagenome]
MDFVGQDDRTVFVRPEFIFRVDEDKALLCGNFLSAPEECQRVTGQGVPLLLRQELLLHDLCRRQRFVMAAIEGLACRRNDRLGQNLVVFHPVRQAHAVHLSLTLLVKGQDRRAGGAGQITADHDFDRQYFKPLADDDIGIGVADHMVGADVLRLFEPVARCLGQDLPLIRNAGKDAVEGAEAVGGYDDAVAVGQIVVFPYLATVIIGQLGNDGFIENAHGFSNS